MFVEDNLLPISALQHLLFCERQCALIHIEGLWAENRLTVEGRQLHQKVHDEGDATRGGVRIARGLPVRSYRLGLFGVADLVEFRPPDESNPSRARPEAHPVGSGIVAASSRDPPQPFPIEYKRGRPKAHDADRVQLCAQALCLEEMLCFEVPGGALFYGKTRRREVVAFDAALRRKVETTAARLHEMIASGRTPTARKAPKCRRCSLLHLCLPDATGPRRSVANYLRRVVTETAQET